MTQYFFLNCNQHFGNFKPKHFAHVVVLADNLAVAVFADPPAESSADAVQAVAASRHFRYLSTDPLNHSVLYAGAV